MGTLDRVANGRDGFSLGILRASLCARRACGALGACLTPLSPVELSTVEDGAPAARVRVLVVDDEEGLRHLLRLILERGGYSVTEARDGAEALERLAADPSLGVVLCDIRMPRMDGHAFLSAISERLGERRTVRVVMMSAYGDSDTAVECLARGAFDYVAKPFRAREILSCVERVAERDRLESENRTLRAAVTPDAALGAFVGRSPEAIAVMDLVRRAARYPSTVLITGESGTGKELLARALHDHSPRAAAPFVPVNCAAIPESLLESELFGHERGAFTGADRARPGLFERADGGTLLLDEIGDMPPALQTRLLRVLEDGHIRRIGSRVPKKVDVRVVAATARDLDAEVRAGRFRDDLYYRLNVVRVRVPPLRTRLDDLPLLAATLVRRAAFRLGRDIKGVSAAALRCLAAHAWPGNVRELENVLERAVISAPASSDQIDIAHVSLDPDLLGSAPSSTTLEPAVAAAAPSSAAPRSVVDFGPDDGKGTLSIKLHAARLERHLIELAMARTGGHRGKAAGLLEISSKALAYKIRDYGIQS